VKIRPEIRRDKAYKGKRGLEAAPDRVGWSMCEEVVQGMRESYLSARDQSSIIEVIE
jgi:hypothetical protein